MSLLTPVPLRAGLTRIVARPITHPTLGSMVALVLPARRPGTLLVDGVASILRDVTGKMLQPKRSVPKRSSPRRSVPKRSPPKRSAHRPGSR